MQHYGTITVVGGGCYGTYYVRQLGRASAAGALAYDRLVVVDRDPGCRVAREALAPAPGGRAGHAPGPEVLIAAWASYFADYLSTAAGTDAAVFDAIVPSPLMPHLMYEWLLQRARARWPGRVVETRPVGREPNIPWQRRAPDDTQYVSFAEWMCPINCIEPATCPAIRGPRTWSLPRALDAYVRAERGRGRDLVGPIIFQCTHRAYGVGMIDARDVVAADALVADAGARGTTEVLVATTSHCHGAVNLLGIGAA